MSHHLISMTVFFPLLGTILQAILPSSRSRWVSFSASLLSSVCAAVLVISMQGQSAELQAIESYSWVGSYAISYDMGVDGLNALMALLIAILFPVLIASEWNQKSGVRGMHGLFLILQTSLFGAVFAQDLFLQFFFWGLSALPFYFLVGIWGGENREKAAFRSMVASSLGNALIFAALVLIYYSVDPHSFALKELSGGKLAGKSFEFLGFQLPVATVAFGLMSAGISMRAPIWPFHGWFTEVAQEAPPSVMVALAAGCVPVAIYIFIRVSYFLFPEILSDVTGFIVGVGIINLIMGGLCAAYQRSLRKLLAFICLSELGLVLMGIGSLSPVGLVGAVYQQMILGLSLAGFGLFSGVISERTGHCLFQDEAGVRTYGGIASKAPFFSVFTGIVVASLIGFPGLAGFVGHALVMIGSYSIHPAAVLVVGGTLLLASYYLFHMYRGIFLGKPAEHSETFSDLTLRERAYLFPVVSGLLFFGLYPKPVIELIRPTILTLLSTVK
ncbi:MAG: complex I subunit 4 family protein [Bdellovibrionia bacterium]